MTDCPTPRIETGRLLLREWREEDLPFFTAMNRDANVTEFLPGMLSVEQSADMVERLRSAFAERGFGLWAVQIKATGQFAGFTGLSVPRFEAAFTPCVEVGWRLAFEHWGKGYATEAAQSAVRFGFEELGLEEIVSFTTTANTRSIRVMEKLGMVRNPKDDFGPRPPRHCSPNLDFAHATDHTAPSFRYRCPDI
jgi:RimJ/RimL family protein N-acetyltransferase